MPLAYTFAPSYEQCIGTNLRASQTAHQLLQRRWTTAQPAVQATNSVPAQGGLCDD